MKKISLLILTVAIVCLTYAQQSPKALTLEQTSEQVYKQQLIDKTSKSKIDSMIVKLNADRKLIALGRKDGSISDQEYKEREKKVSGNFNAELKRVLGEPEVFKKWQAVRFHKTL